MFDGVQREYLALPVYRLEHRACHESDWSPLFDRDHQGPRELRGYTGVPNQRMLLEDVALSTSNRRIR